MKGFGSALWFGLLTGLVWGLGCAVALLYSIFLAGYRKAVEDSLAAERPKRFRDVLARVQARKSGSSGV
ncbi:MAG TPA: hypothetical protein VKR52_14690 [Terracidiphilus sp.]|nr:hypothetical protein [Terracidiphilus sp.]